MRFANSNINIFFKNVLLKMAAFRYRPPPVFEPKTPSTPEEFRLLIQLNYELKSLMDYMDYCNRFSITDKRDQIKFENEIKNIVDQLGFSEEIYNDMILNIYRAEYIHSRLTNSLNMWARDSDRYLDLPYYDIGDEEFSQMMNEHTLDMRSQFILSNPFTVWNIEKRHNFEETGVASKLIEKWNKTYYTTNCSQYNNSYNCLWLAIRSNNVEGFKKYYVPSNAQPDPDIDDMFGIIGIIRDSVSDIREVLKYIMDEKIILPSDYDNLFTSIIEGDIGGPAPEAEVNAIYVFERANITTERLNELFQFIATDLNFPNLVKLIIDTRPDLSQEVIDETFEYLLQMATYIDVIAALKPRIDPNYDFEPVIEQLYSDHEKDFLRNLVNLFDIEVDDDMLEYFMSPYWM